MFEERGCLHQEPNLVVGKYCRFMIVLHNECFQS